jgi:hypothetical protein
MDPVLVVGHRQLGSIAVLADLCISNVITNDAEKDISEGKDSGQDGMDLVLVAEEKHGLPTRVIPKEEES